ncbi:MAG: ABC transporter substrate-binding protein [Ruminococcus sp.]|nr:ABC transporter substrate-binding protein [Ruminococcus sp.]MCM1480237.1 ABC transporter substrate-binding protein [Muribaculaceae bacterium]
MRNKLRILSLFAAAVMALSVTGCSESAADETETSAATSAAAENNQSDSAESKETSGDETDVPAKSGTHIVIDHTGNEIEVPDNVTRVVIDQIPILSTYMSYFEGDAPYIVGYCGAFKDIITKTALKDIAPELMESSDTVYAQSDLNIEEIMKLEPDVILYNAANTAHKEIFESSGIPAVGFATSASEAAGKADIVDRYVQWLRLLEDVFGEDEKMDSFIGAGNEIISDVEARIAAIPESGRPSGIILTTYSDGVPTVAGGKFFGAYWLERLGVSNPAEAAGLVAHAQVNIEQIYEWDTDILFLNGPGLLPYKTEDALNNTIEGLDLSALSAVKNGRVYDTTLGMWNWYTPNPDVPIIYAWLACKTYPDEFADYPLEDTIKDYYKQWYGYDVTDEDMAGMLLY